MSTKDVRGFVEYVDFSDSYGAEVRVKESSSASGPHVWIFVEGGSVCQNEGAAHLTLAQAVLVRDALDEFIKENSQ